MHVSYVELTVAYAAPRWLSCAENKQYN